MERSLEGKVSVITGGSRGIGKAIAEELIKRGAICILLARDRNRLKEAVIELRKKGGEVKEYSVDIVNQEEVKAVIDKIEEEYKEIEILVNNAGVGGFKSVVDMSIDEWNNVINVNLNGVFYITKEILPFMIRRNKGVIVNIASLAGRNSFKGGSAYCASKAALIAFSECLMHEVRDYNIKVGVILPGSVATDFSDRQDKSWMLLPYEVARQVINMIETGNNTLLNYMEIRPLKPIK